MLWSTEDKVACHRRQMSGTTKGRWSGSNGEQKRNDNFRQESCRFFLYYTIKE